MMHTSAHFLQIAKRCSLLAIFLLLAAALHAAPAVICMPPILQVPTAPPQFAPKMGQAIQAGLAQIWTVRDQRDLQNALKQHNLDRRVRFTMADYHLLADELDAPCVLQTIVKAVSITPAAAPGHHNVAIRGSILVVDAQNRKTRHNSSFSLNRSFQGDYDNAMRELIAATVNEKILPTCRNLRLR